MSTGNKEEDFKIRNRPSRRTAEETREKRRHRNPKKKSNSKVDHNNILLEVSTK